MSENIWSDNSPYNDTLEYDSNGNWTEPASAAIPANPARQSRPQAPAQQSRFQLPPEQEQQIVEEVLQEMADDEEEDQSVLSDATLRLEQGRLYQMVMNHNLFQGMDADPRAIKNVQREIRKFARERMEIMLGMRQETQVQPIISSPFNDLEVQALRMLAAKVTGGKSEQISAAAVPASSAKKDLTPISGSTKPAQAPASMVQRPAQKPSTQKLQSKPSAPVKRQAPAPEQSAELAEINAVMDGQLTKRVEEMTSDELIAHNKKISERQSARRVKAQGALPMPTPDQEEMLYAQRASSPAVSAIVAAINSNKRQ